ncbi:MAG: cold shock domain-containing protein [Solirubrobacterales bacterium]|nr:cold shock domain-containing protein [Solirubrobacterales bacterium]
MARFRSRSVPPRPEHPEVATPPTKVGRPPGDSSAAFVVVAISTCCFRSTKTYLPGRESRHGALHWFSDENGFEFITPDDQSKDLFVHHSSISSNGFKSLAEGAKGSYNAEQGLNGRPPGTFRRAERMGLSLTAPPGRGSSCFKRTRLIAIGMACCPRARAAGRARARRSAAACPEAPGCRRRRAGRGLGRSIPPGRKATDQPGPYPKRIK